MGKWKTMLPEELDINKRYSIKERKEAFDYLLKSGYVYDCETDSFQAFRNKYTGEEVHIPHSIIDKIEEYNLKQMGFSEKPENKTRKEMDR